MILGCGLQLGAAAEKFGAWREDAADRRNQQDPHQHTALPARFSADFTRQRFKSCRKLAVSSGIGGGAGIMSIIGDSALP